MDINIFTAEKDIEKPKAVSKYFRCNGSNDVNIVLLDLTTNRQMKIKTPKSLLS